MDENIQKTFIPRKRIDPMSAGLKVESTIDLFSAISFIVFSLAFFASLGVFLSNIYVNSKIETLKKEASTATAYFNKEDTVKLVALDKKITAVSSILNKHNSLSKVLKFLEEITVSRVSINDFNYIIDQMGEGIIIDASAKNYNSLANQSAVFKENKNIKSYTISNIEPNEDGEVSFKAEIVLTDGAFLYKEKTQ